MMSFRKATAALLLAGWAALAAIPAAAQEPVLPQPGTKELCPVCGMLVSKYPNWTALALYKDGHAHFFDGAKDLFKYLAEYPKYAPGHTREEIAGTYVTEFYGLTRIPAEQALYVVGSDVMGPMGHELVPLANREDAAEFQRDHQGKRILGFDEVTPELLRGIDAGVF